MKTVADLLAVAKSDQVACPGCGKVYALSTLLARTNHQEVICNCEETKPDQENQKVKRRSLIKTVWKKVQDILGR